MTPDTMLHVLPAAGPHDEVVILGTEAGLLRLQRAITRALAHYHASTGTVFHAADGEGFEVLVVQTSAFRLGGLPPHYAPRERLAMPPWFALSCEAAGRASE